MILAANPLAQYRAHKDEIDAAVRRVLEKGWYILGDEVQRFEAEFAAYAGVAHAIGVGSGTEALHLAIAACGIGPGDEVISVSHTSVATIAAIELAGATPVLVDIEPNYYTLDPGKLQGAISERTRAVIPVHLYGHPADLDPILEIARRHGLRVIEDCAQAHGARYRDRRVGAWGDIACFSFYPTKNLGALGDGGMVITDDGELADRLRLLRQYGWVERHVSQVAGWNSRLDEIQASVLQVKLRHLDNDNSQRRSLAAKYTNALCNAAVSMPQTRPGSTHVYHQFVVRCARRDSLREFLEKTGVQALIHYPVPLHLQPAYRGRISVSGSLSETERAAIEVLSLPLYPELSQQEMETVVEAVHAFQ
ncbi:MAG TPA: DegT/DnrJ/EryC1/StrS family aminotransferase [Acidobacteriota bacterium]